MANARKQHDGLLVAHVKAATLAAAGAKPNLDKLKPYRDDEERVVMKPSEYRAMHGN